MTKKKTRTQTVRTIAEKLKDGAVSLSPPPMFSAFAFFASIVVAVVFPAFAVAAAVLAVGGVLGMMAEDYRLQHRRLAHRDQANDESDHA